MNALSGKEREAVAIGAAIGAGCRPCTQYHVNAALKAGLTREEVALALKEAHDLRVEAVAAIVGFAQGLLGEDVKVAPWRHDPARRRQALVQIGAATGGNAGHFLERIVPQARGLGLPGGTLREAVGVAGMVKK